MLTCRFLSLLFKSVSILSLIETKTILVEGKLTSYMHYSKMDYSLKFVLYTVSHSFFFQIKSLIRVILFKLSFLICFLGKLLNKMTLMSDLIRKKV